MHGLPTFLDDALNHRFLTQYLSRPEGRATLLMQLAEAEGGDGGELNIFDHLLAVLDDEEVKKTVRIHKADEERHEQLFAAAAKAQGAPAVRMPHEVQLLRRLDARTGFFSRPIVDKAGVAEAYILLLVIEERALKQFAKMRKAFAALGHHDIVVLLDQIASDEERHLRYCHAIAKRALPDDAARDARIAQMRVLEQQCFDEVQALNLQVIVRNGHLPNGAWGGLWRFLAGVSKRRVAALTPAMA